MRKISPRLLESKLEGLQGNNMLQVVYTS